MTEPSDAPDSDGFDAVFTWYAASDAVREIFRQGLGEDLPADVEPFSFVPLSGLREIAAALRVGPGDLLVDLACGRGGPGLWVAAATGATLLGIDFSPVGLEHARTRAARFVPPERARFTVGRLDATGLDDASADGLLCIDAVHMADPEATVAEIARVLAPGASVVLTGWESDQRERWSGDLAALLTAAGLREVVVTEKPDWLARQLDTYARARTVAATSEDPAVAALAAEGEWFAQEAPAIRRVLAQATR